jgi:thiamine biosynthesis lipoprotein
VALFLWGTLRERGAGAPRATTLDLHGLALGTTWRVSIANAQGRAADLAAARMAVETALAEVERQMSVFHPASEISQFNAAPADTPIEISEGFAQVVRFALDLAERSGGAFDPTVAPLVELWGFGPHPRPSRPPSDDEVAAAREAVGFERIVWEGPRRLAKRHPQTRLDLNAVAKGYAVDRVAVALEELGLRHFFVEVGGEIVTRGRRPGGGPWRIGVDRPVPGAPPGADLQRVLRLNDAAVATSGDYRNILHDETAGGSWTHLFDPRDGRPVRRMAGSVTVVADTCLKADGLATTLFVMGPDDGLPWLARHFPEAEALFVLRAPDGTFAERTSSGFVQAIQGEESLRK